RAVVAGLVLPEPRAGAGVEGVELVTAEAAAEEHLPVHHGRRGQRPAARDDHLPAFLAFLAGEGDGGADLGRRLAALRVILADLRGFGPGRGGLGPGRVSDQRERGQAEQRHEVSHEYPLRRQCVSSSSPRRLLYPTSGGKTVTTA